MIRKISFNPTLKVKICHLDAFFNSGGIPVLVLVNGETNECFYKELKDVEDLDNNAVTHIKELLAHTTSCKILLTDCSIAYMPSVQRAIKQKGITQFSPAEPRESTIVVEMVYKLLSKI